MSFPSKFPYTENATSSSGSNVPEKYDQRRGQVATCEEWISGRKWGLFDGSVVVVACVSCGQGEVIWISYPTVHPYPKVEAVKEKKPDFTTAIHDTVVHNKFIHSFIIHHHGTPDPLHSIPTDGLAAGAPSRKMHSNLCESRWTEEFRVKVWLLRSILILSHRVYTSLHRILTNVLCMPSSVCNHGCMEWICKRPDHHYLQEFIVCPH